MPEEQGKPPAPYLPWKTFFNSLDTFSQGIPPRIDRTIWRAQSGLMQGLIMGAYRFFGLVDVNDRPTALLQRVVQNTNERAAVIGGLLKSSYPDIFAHDLSTMTTAMLNDLIEKYNVSGSTKKKAITFFLQAAKYAGLPLSNFIQVRSTTGTRRRRLRNNEEENEIESPSEQKSGSEKVVELSSGGTVTLKVVVDFLSISDVDRKFVFDLVDKMGNYANSNVDQSRRVVRRITTAEAS
jgi:Family of unknown function (DUF5343)